MDYGSLLCWASNSVGRQESPCIFHLVPAGKPDPVNNCSVNNQSHSSFHLNCQPGFDGGLPQTFIMEVRDMQDGFMVSNVSSQTPSFSVNGLQSGKSFSVQLFSANSKGQSEKVILQAFTLEAKEAEIKTELGESGLLRSKFTITPILGVLIGVGAALVLVCVSIIVTICWRSRPKRNNNSEPIYKQKKASEDLRIDSSNLESLIQDKCPDIIPINNGEYLQQELIFT